MENVMADLFAKSLLRDINDFPTPGIIFKDITPVLANARAFQEVIDLLVQGAQERSPDVIAGVESRGFMFAAPVALRLGLGFVPIRKAGKLPYQTLREEYDLEYGSSAVEIHTDAIKPGQRVLIIDDVLATGGTAGAAARLVEKAGGKVCAISFVLELEFLVGRAQLPGYEVDSLIKC
jgi:adenine phosphoribosyltransferase